MSKPQTKAGLLTPQGVDGFEPHELARDSSGWSVCWLLRGLVIKYPFGWDQKLYYPLRAHLWILAFWTNDCSSAGLSVVRGCFPNTNFESSPTIWTHGGPWKIVFEGLERWEVLTISDRVCPGCWREMYWDKRLRRCTPLERVCGSKHTLTDSWDSAGSRVNLCIAIIKRLCSFLAPNMGHFDSNRVDGRGKNLFCS